MIISPSSLFKLLCLSLVYGVVIGVLNDINKIFKIILGKRYYSVSDKKLFKILKINNIIKAPKAKNFIINAVAFVQDLVLLLLFVSGIIILNHYYNDGRFRLLSIVSSAVGFLIYNLTFGKLFVYIMEPIVILICSLFKKAILIIVKPIVFAVSLICKLFYAVKEYIKKYIAKKVNLSYNIKVKNRLSQLSKTGFNDSVFLKEFYNEDQL